MEISHAAVRFGLGVLALLLGACVCSPGVETPVLLESPTVSSPYAFASGHFETLVLDPKTIHDYQALQTNTHRVRRLVIKLAGSGRVGLFTPNVDIEVGPLLTVLATLPELECLTLAIDLPYTITDIGNLSLLAGCRNLRSLQLEGVEISDRWLNFLPRMPHLTELVVDHGSKSGNLCRDTLELIAKCSGLRRLALAVGSVEGDDLLALGALKKLELLHLAGGMHDNFRIDPKSFTALIEALPRLRILSLLGLWITDGDAPVRIQSSSLECVYMDTVSCEAADLEWIPGLPRLSNLTLHGMVLTEDLARRLYTLRAESLEVGYAHVKIAGDSKTEYARLKHTAALLPASPVDAGPRRLILGRLHLYHTSAGFIRALANLKRLETLVINDTGELSEGSLEAALADLRRLRPDLQITR